MAHTPSQVVPLDFTPQSSPYPHPSSEDEYPRNSVPVDGDEEPYSDPVVYEVHPTEIPFSVAHHTCPLYVLGIPCYCVIPVVAQSNIPSAPIVHVAPSSSTPTPAAPSAQAATNHRCSETRTKEDLTALEQSIISSPWHAANALEPICGSPNCPYHADRYGIRGLSCYTAFVDTKPDGTFGCRYEGCSQYSVRRLEDAVKHQRTNHFNHRPFLCVPANGTACDKRFFSLTDLRNHQRRCH